MLYILSRDLAKTVSSRKIYVALFCLILPLSFFSKLDRKHLSKPINYRPFSLRESTFDSQKTWNVVTCKNLLLSCDVNYLKVSGFCCVINECSKTILSIFESCVALNNSLLLLIILHSFYPGYSWHMKTWTITTKNWCKKSLDFRWEKC